MSDDILDPHHRRRDLNLLRKAIRNGWDIPAELRERLPEALAEIALNEGKAKGGKRQAKKYDARSRIGAARVLVQMDKINAAAEANANHADGPDEPGDLHLHLHKHEAARIEVVHVPDWYGVANDSDDAPATADLPAREPPTSASSTP